MAYFSYTQNSMLRSLKCIPGDPLCTPGGLEGGLFCSFVSQGLSPESAPVLQVQSALTDVVDWVTSEEECPVWDLVSTGCCTWLTGSNLSGGEQVGSSVCSPGVGLTQ